MQSKNRFLVIYLGATIGDSILATSSISLLKSYLPHAEITFLVRSPLGDLFNKSSYISKVIEVDYKRLKKSLLYNFKIVSLLKHDHYDIAILLDQKLRPAMLAYFAQIPVRIGPNKVYYSPNRMAKNLWTHSIDMGDIMGIHMTEFFQRVVSGYLSTHNATQKARPFIGRNAQLERYITDKILSLSEAGILNIGICLSASNPWKSWPNRYMSELLDKVSSRYSANFYVVGAEKDFSSAEELLSLTKARVVNLCGKTNLAELAAVIRDMNLFISVDTAAMHIAAAADVPLVALFGPFSPECWGPVSDKAISLWNRIYCSPCNCQGINGNCADQKCMNDLKVDEVYQAVVSQLEQVVN